jgi:hypothetical protein
LKECGLLSGEWTLMIENTGRAAYRRTNNKA